MLKNAGSLCFFVGFCAAAYVDTLPKCSIKDQDCLKSLYPNVIEKIAKTGLDELGIPILEPMEVKNLTVSFLGALDVILEKGTITGISGCTFDALTLDIEKGSGNQENTCSLIIEGVYNIIPTVLINTVLGENGISGNGNLKLILDNVNIKFDFPMHVEKRDDGETYLKVHYDDIEYAYDIKGFQISADNIKLGGVETSKTIVPVFNENWQFMNRIFGKFIIDPAVKIYFTTVAKFFENVPSKNYISDDLSSFAKP